MTGLLILLMIAGLTAYLYFKSNFVNSFVFLIIIILASVPAFAYYEYASSFVISSDSNKMGKLVTIIQPLCFLVIFGLCAAILQIAANSLSKEKIDLGVIPERAGRIVCGIFSGLLLSGVFLTAAGMAPLPTKYPYERFSSANPDIENPTKAMLNADGFAVGWFNLLSKGSLSGKNTFSVLHSDFLDTLYLNRLGLSKQISITSAGTAAPIEVPNEKGVWPAPEDLTDTSGKPVRPKMDTVLTIVRVGLTKNVLKTKGAFTPLQLRVICKPKDQLKNIYKGSAQVIYPIGYMKTSTELEYKSLTGIIKPTAQDFDGPVKWVDFVYHVPVDYVPVLLRFKLNILMKLSEPIDISEAPDIMSFELPERESVESEKDEASEIGTKPLEEIIE